jgi:hypothetical protein
MTVGMVRVGKPKELGFVASRLILNTDDEVPLGS